MDSSIQDIPLDRPQMGPTTAAKMKILVLTKRQYMGKDLLDDRFGRFRELPLQLARLGHDVKGISSSYRPRDEGTSIDADCSQGGSVAWHSMDVGLSSLRSYCRRTRELAMNFKPDLVWACSDVYHAIFGVWLTNRIQTRCIIDLYDNFESFGASKLPFVLHWFRQAVKEADGVTCFSKRLADYVAESYRRRKPTAVIENGVRKDLFRVQDQQSCRQRFGLPANVKIIGTAGALHRGRDVETLFRAFETLSNERTDIHLALAGPRSRSVRIPSSPKIHDLGILPHEEVASFVAALDLCIVGYRPSAQGQFSLPQKAYEIIACRVPLIAAAVGTMNELLINYPECLYEAENPDSLADAIRRQLDARIVVTMNVPSWADSAERLATFFETVLRESPADVDSKASSAGIA
jgi:teichuronic acid biosynthesis glycosyltransferase TuaC